MRNLHRLLGLAFMAGTLGAARAAPAPDAPPACRLGEQAPDRRDAAKERALRQWASERQDQMRKEDAGATFEFLDHVGGDLDDMIRERSVSHGICREGYWHFSLRLDQGKCAYQIDSAGPYAENCCAGAPCPDRTPAGWMLELFRRSEQKDQGALLALIDPRRGFMDIGDEGRRRAFKRKQGPRSARAIESSWTPEVDHLECPERFTGGKAECTVGRSGGYTTYRWMQEGANVYLLAREAFDTGE